ncbi:hypothetical protein [Aquisalibacillus elongatus]|uniref:Uncharacterized protein n=1 Tax=Aquisalibacillus elongatus TaxID=485577 RepID=A0A3N5B3N2_9BACI|nr:hypothetical protein [Aquisalibacillus elongatus]RPF52266.1 hypothetical protein EDC24_2259 [Aquisalibacillus elongatus]
MNTNKKLLITGLIVVVLLVGIIVYLSYLGLKQDPEKSNEVKEEARQYLEENYNTNYEINDILYDNVDVYEQFSYAAMVELPDTPYQVLVFEDSESGEYTDSYVAETWEHELETYLLEQLNEAYGKDQIQEVWLTYPKNIGQELGLGYPDVPSVKEFDVKPIIRITLDRGEEDQDEEKLDRIIENLQTDLNVDGGSINLSYNDSAILFKDKDIKKDF